MDKIMAILSKAKASLTVLLMGATAIFSQIDPVANWFAGIVNQLAPGKAVMVTAVLAVLARLRSIVTNALATVQKVP